MAKTEIEELRANLETIVKWKEGRSVNALLDTFIQLNFLDVKANKEEWQKIKEALATNSELKDEDVRQYLTVKAFAKKGFWWWDPENWTLEEE